MLQLNKSQATNTIAFYPDIPLSAGVTQIQLSGSQDYSRTGSVVNANVVSNADTTPWVIAELAGALLPDASGFYTYDIYEISPGSSLVWNTTNTQWQLTNTLWNAGTAANKLVTTRALISGSDVTPITQYVSPDENGAYTTYLG